MKYNLLSSVAVTALLYGSFLAFDSTLNIANAGTNASPDPCSILTGGTTHCPVGQGVVWTPAQWIAAFQSKVDATGGFLNTGSIGAAGTPVAFGNFSTLEVAGTLVSTLDSIVIASGLSINGGSVCSGTLLTSGTLSILECITLISTVSPTIVSSMQNQALEFTSGGNPVISISPTTVLSGFASDLFFGINSGKIITTTGTITSQGSTFYGQPYQGIRIINDGSNIQAIIGSPFVQQSGGYLVYAQGLMIGSLNVNNGSGLPNFIVGQNNTISGGYSGIFGQGATGSFTDSAVAGSNAVGTSGASNNLYTGYNSHDYGLNNGFIQSSGSGSSGITFGKQQRQFIMIGTGSGTVAITLTSDGVAPSIHNTGSIPGKSMASFEEVCNIVDVTNGGYAIFKGTSTGGLPGLINQPTTLVASTTIASGFTFGAGPSLGTFSSIGTFADVGDTTNGGHKLTYTPGVGNTGSLDTSCKIFELDTN